MSPLLLQRVRRVCPPSWILLPIIAVFFLELCFHLYQFNIPIPDDELDNPFVKSCQEPELSAPRENAVLVMLARNEELHLAKRTVESVERSFNRWYRYPIVFLNDEPWSAEFIQQLNETSSGEAMFEVIPREQWTFPAWVDGESARQSIREQGTPHGSREAYHHMCRFYSGKFYELEVLKKYKWYWRLEPHVDFTCSITYDPFVQMAKHNKVYGYAIALWEVGTTCPSLFRHMADWMEGQHIKPSHLWKAMMEGSWMPFPLRNLMRLLPHRDRRGDAWSLCHYWSNFEIADMDFFRGRRYQELFEYLDKQGGFYYERWGDAAVHSLAVAMLLEPQQMHHFDDFGYKHGPFYQCPANSPGGQLPKSKLLGGLTQLPEGNPEVTGGIGCRCRCDRGQNFSRYCAKKLKLPNTRDRSWGMWFLMDKTMLPVRFLVLGAVSGCAFLVGKRWCYRGTGFGRVAVVLVVVLGIVFFLHAVS